MQAIRPTPNDALLIVDVQNDFLAGGPMPVPVGDEVIPFLNRYIDLFERQALALYAVRDWHPPNHCSFKSEGGMWPSHCVAGSKGAEFPSSLALPDTTVIVSKATTAIHDAYSSFDGTDLADRLQSHGTQRLFIGGLSTDYCVVNTVIDALHRGFEVFLLIDAIRAVDFHPGDGQLAIDEMTQAGAITIQLADIDASARSPRT